MLRLRTTTALSALTLAAGIAGTAWMSTLTAQWPGGAQPFATGREPARPVASRPHPPRQRPARTETVAAHRATAPRVIGAVVEEARADVAAPVELVPVATPVDRSQSWDALRGHLDGRVLLHVDVDGGGRVVGAYLLESSGDPILDEHALRSVRGWRFAVPSDHPDGLSGELPMRFSSHGNYVAQLR